MIYDNILETIGNTPVIKIQRLAPEGIVDGTDPIQADSDIVIADVGNALAHGLVNQRAVAGQPDVKAHCFGARRNLKNVRPQKGFAPR